MPLPDTLPDLLRDHLDPDRDGFVPLMSTMTMWGRGEMRMGSMPWLPLRMRTVHRVGLAFASGIELTWHGRPFLSATEAYVDGRGLSRQGGTVTVGPEIDQGANLFLWSEAVLIPSVHAGPHAPGVEQVASDVVAITLPLGEATETARLTFDGTHPTRFSALRHKGVGRPKVGWHVDYEDWRAVSGILLPSRISVTWQDEGRPWFRLRTDGFAANVDVDSELAGVAAALADVS